MNGFFVSKIVLNSRLCSLLEADFLLVPFSFSTISPSCIRDSDMVMIAFQAGGLMELKEKIVAEKCIREGHGN
jgi:hypothetical protein